MNLELGLVVLQDQAFDQGASFACLLHRLVVDVLDTLEDQLVAPAKSS